MTNSLLHCYKITGHKIHDLGNNQRVALMLTMQAQRNMISWQPHGPKIMEAYFKEHQFHINIIIYFSQQTDTEVKNYFYDQLDKRVGQLLGDFNDNVGRKS